MPVIEVTATQMPVLALRGVVVFPNTVASFDVGRKMSINALKYAMEKNQLIYLVAQKDCYIEEPENDDLYKIGCVAKIKQVLRVSDTLTKVLVQGIHRATHSDFYALPDFYTARVSKCEEKPINNREIYKETLLRRVKTQFAKYMSLMPKSSPDIEMTVENCEDLGFLCDFIAFNINAPYDDKQYILEQLSPVKRAKILIELLEKEHEINQIDRRIAEKTRFSIDENQKEYYLREQLKVISNELYGDDSADEIDTYHTKIESLCAEKSVKETLHSHVNKLSKMPQGSHEGTVERGYLDTCIELPWNAYTKTSNDILKAEKILNRDIYGLQKVKERILELLSIYALSPDIKGQIICLVGPPGVGKTSIGKTVAECMGRKFARVALGGVHDESEIRGHRKTYIGAMPGKIINAIKSSGSGNPVILLDEVDKLGKDFKGDPASALLEVLDPEQNNTFVDHFIEIPYDLSRVVFLATANTLDTIPAPLLDRMEVIEVSSYTREEKFQIAKKHLVAKQISRHGLAKSQVKFGDDALYSLIDFYTREAGVRKLERNIASLCRKSAKLIAGGEKKRVTIGGKAVENMLGRHKYSPEVILAEDTVGIINGLAWTQVGGEIMQLEVTVMDGTGKVELTGSLGDVMKESAKTAVSFVRSNAEKYGIDSMFYKNRDIHIHATEAAVPKDGPSAGVTMVTALVSALTNRKIRRDIAMTGEVTLRGRVLKIGGLREKSMAAYRGGVKTVFIPKENLADLEDVDSVVKQNVRFIPVSNVNEILDYAFVKQQNNQPQTNNIFEDFSAVSHNTVSQ
ncbi:MAG: endopeptidase La [Ruminococcaceae bacterium]|nr:endopeptidase La [Oscillospiraceae bacterium]